jgi:hypothetical protein
VTVPSSISFDRVKLDETSFVMMFPKLNVQPGTHARLALERSEDATNQIWVFTEGESFTQELSHLTLYSNSPLRVV